jgi:hypothetical protein
MTVFFSVNDTFLGVLTFDKSFLRPKFYSTCFKYAQNEKNNCQFPISQRSLLDGERLWYVQKKVQLPAF